MAVQAQYPSNVLLLNRNTQEGKNTIGNDYSLQQQCGGGDASPLFEHQLQVSFNSRVGNNNNRKRSREFMSPMNGLQQSESWNQIKDYSQIHQNKVVSTGLGLAFNEQLHHQTQQHFSLLPSQSSQKSSTLLPFLSDDLASHINQQRQEIQNFITFQGEQLRRASAEKRRRNLKTLLIAAEETVAKRLREKEAEVEKALRLNSELELKVAQLSGEVQAWQARAREQELTAAALQEKITHAMLSGGGGSGGAAEDAESVYVDPRRVGELNGPSCKACGERVGSVVLLPCRHLCLCRECDSVAKFCPLCYTFRSSSVEVIMG